MTHRSPYLPVITFLVGLLCLSVGFNILFLNKINKLYKIVNTISQPVSDQELKELMEEVKRLSNAKYDIKTRKIIDGFETYQK
jgi:hypothetical protein